MSNYGYGPRCHIFKKIHIYCFTLREQNHVYLLVRGDLWPYKIQQIRLRPGLRPGPRWGSLRRSPRPLVGWGGDTFGASFVQ